MIKHVVTRLAGRSTGRQRKGTIIVLSAFLLIVVLAFVSLAVDISYISLTRTRMQNACDAAALAAAMEISNAIQTAGPEVQDVTAYSLEQARQTAAQVAAMNGVYVDPIRDVRFGRKMPGAANSSSGVEWGTTPANCVQVVARRDSDVAGAPDSRLSLFFAPVIGHSSSAVATVAAAYIESRDLVVVHDFSRSMNFDSWFSTEALAQLSKSQIETNLRKVWDDLGLNCGTMTFEPQYLTVNRSQNGFQAAVTFRYNMVDVVANENISSVEITYTNGSKQVRPGSGNTGTFQGTSTNATRDISSVAVTMTKQVQGSYPPSSQVTLTGAAPTSSTMPQIYVTYRADRKSVYITSTKDLSNVVLEFCDGIHYKFDGLTGKTGTFAGIGSNSGKTIKTVWVKSGSNFSNDGPGYGERFNNPTVNNDCQLVPPPTTTQEVTLTFDDTNANVMAMFGLNSINYPYSGSWNAIVNHGRNNANYINQGYREMYGGMTVINYILSTQSGGWQTPDLWKTRHYPFHAIKQGHELFCQILSQMDLGDELGMVSYDTNHRIETILNKPNPLIPYVNISSDPITSDYTAVNNLMKYRQANEYSSATNMGGGMKTALWLLDNHKRVGSRPTMLLMTDGNSNTIDPGTDTSLPPGWNWHTLLDYDGDGVRDYFTTDPQKHYVLKMAKEAVDKGYTIHTMSVGSDADRQLMKAVAHIGKGHWVDVPGGTTVEEIEQDLRDAFHKIATFVPPAKLVRPD